MPLLFVFSIIAFLIFVNALYVAAEFSAVSSRRSRLSQLADEGNSLAAGMVAIVESPEKLDVYVATCQIGITISSLILGEYGRAQLSPYIAPWLARWLGGDILVAAQVFSATLILLFLTSLQVLFGELVPKNIGIQYPEQLAMATLLPLRWSMALFKPLIWLFNGSGHLIMRLMGRKVVAEYAHIHSPNEIVMLIEESGQGGLIEQEERRLLKNTLEMRDSMVRQVMIPRTQMLAAPDNLTCDELFTLLADSRFSRLPLYRGTIDNIVGVVHLKDLLCMEQQLQLRNVADILRPVPFFPETIPVKTVFSLLQRKHLQVAIVLDEFGGTAGMVTLEDLIEEIFGELQDEFDVGYVPPYRLLPGNRLWIRGDTLIEELNERLEELRLPDRNVDTIGGLILNAIGPLPGLGTEIEGQEVEINGWKFRVEKTHGRGVTAVSLALTPQQIQKLQEGEA